MKSPSFIGIGAQKCASTWIYDILQDHPDVCLSDRKELDFFSHHFDRGYRWYERHFSPAPHVRAIGEISPSYFHEPAVPARVQAYLPEARIILSLRDPVDRAFSHHCHAVRMGDLDGEDYSFESALAANPMYLEQGRYATHLQRWLDCFPQEQLLVLFFEDIVHRPAEVARRVYRFLGVDEEHCSERLGTRSNASHVIPYASLEKVRAGLRAGVRKAGLDRVWELLAMAGARRLYRGLNRRPTGESIPQPRRDTRARMRALFRDEVDRLEVMTGRDLVAWRADPLEKSTPSAVIRGQAPVEAST